MKRLTQFIKWAFWLVIITGTISATGLGVFLFELSKTLPQNLEDELHKRNDVLPTVLYDREGNQIEELFKSYFSDPPLEEDDLPPGEWICHRCRVMPPQIEVRV